MLKFFERFKALFHTESQQSVDEEYPQLHPSNKPDPYRFPPTQFNCNIFGCPRKRPTSSIRTLTCCGNGICKHCEENLKTDAEGFLRCAFCRSGYKPPEERRNPKRQCREGKWWFDACDFECIVLQDSHIEKYMPPSVVSASISYNLFACMTLWPLSLQINWLE